jgi:hypothetical protein
MSAFNRSGADRLEAKMSGLIRYRAMESLCRQSAVFYPLESWRLLAEAEMWHHKAEEEMACAGERVAVPSAAVLARDAARAAGLDESRGLAD